MSVDEITDLISEIKINEFNHFKTDVWNPWSGKSDNISFKPTLNGVGPGEEMLSKELNLNNVGGQNSITDLEHHELGNISVKDMTNDDCRLGVECTQNMNKLFRRNILRTLK